MTATEDRQSHYNTAGGSLPMSSSSSSSPSYSSTVCTLQVEYYTPVHICTVAPMFVSCNIQFQY